MSLYKVMLVDDEQEMLEAISRRIDWQSIGLAYPVLAKNGIEALEVAEEDTPDIVMTDIKMPYMDGLTLARKLKEFRSDIRVIILSGFDEFEYAKEAIHLEAEEYILKPVDSTELTKIFKRIKEDLDEERNQRQNQEMLEQYYMDSLPVLQENLLVSVIQGKVPAERIPEYIEEYQLHMPGPYYCAAMLYTSHSRVPEGMNYVLLSMAVKKLAEEKIRKAWHPCFCSYLSSIVIIFSLPNPAAVHKLTDEMETFCRLANSVCQAVVTCGIGQVTDKPSELSNSYNGARQAVSYRVIYGSIKAINITEIAPEEIEDHEDTGDLDLMDVFKRIKIDDEEELKNSIDNFLEKHGHKNSVQGYRLFVLDLVGELCRFARTNDMDIKSIFGCDDNIYQDIQTKDLDSLHKWMDGICLQMQKSMRIKRCDTSRSFVEKAKDYVNEHYSDTDLSIATVCNELGVSSAYFSTIFKKETGKTFINYLTDYRMNKAITLLVSANYKTYVIAQKVGYSDPNYFSYVFRKQYGVSPSKYKKEN